MENGAQLLEGVCVGRVCVQSVCAWLCLCVCACANACVCGAVVLRVHAHVALCMTTDGTSFCGHKHTHTHTLACTVQISHVATSVHTQKGCVVMQLPHLKVTCKHQGYVHVSKGSGVGRGAFLLSSDDKRCSLR